MIKIQWIVFLIFIIMPLLLFTYIFFEVNFPKTHFITVQSPKLPSEAQVKILQLTDYHNNSIVRLRKHVLEAIEQHQPDMIVITGDFIDQKTKDYEAVYEFVEEIIKLNPHVYFVNGNHENKNKGKNAFLSELNNKNIYILNNSNRMMAIGDVNINICGVDDFYSRKSDFHKAFDRVDKNLFTILLSHSPDLVYGKEEVPADLILSGHTHGGQIRMPFIGALIAPGQGLFPKYSKGLYSLGENRYLYIDSGLGTTRIPVRVLNRSQISLIRLVRKN